MRLGRVLSAVGIVVLLACGAASSNGGDPCELTGRWTGAWVRRGYSLPVEFDFARVDSGLDGTFGSRDFQAAGIPLRDVRCGAGRVHFELVGDEDTTRFDGDLGDHALRGTFSNGRSIDTLRLTRTAGAAGPSYASEEIRFTSGEATLAGTLLVPSGAGRHPAIVFLHGSGPEGRSANRFLADRCARAGVAALIYDKRGVGGSTGDWRRVGFDSLAADAIAGVERLRADPRVRPDAIGIFGHSQGATIAPLVASRSPHVTFVVASAPSGVSMAALERFSVLNAIGIRRLPPADSARAGAYVDLLVRTEYAGGSWAELDSAALANRGQPWSFRVPDAADPFWLLSRANSAYDPRSYWEQVRVPVLLLFGERDERTPVDASRRNIEAALRRAGNRHVTERTFPGADHSLRLASGEPGSPWPRSAPRYPEIVLDWIHEATMARQQRPRGLRAPRPAALQ